MDRTWVDGELFGPVLTRVVDMPVAILANPDRRNPDRITQVCLFTPASARLPPPDQQPAFVESAALVLMRKKNGAVRVCVDNRPLNAVTVPWPYTIASCDEIMDRLGIGGDMFSSCDLY